jgi:hypothetical protein
MSNAMKSGQCKHCGKTTVFEFRGEGTQNGAVVDDNYKDGQDITWWRIFECQACKMPILEEVKIW